MIPALAAVLLEAFTKGAALAASVYLLWKQKEGKADTILDALFWLYTEHNSLDSDTIKAQFARLREYLKLPPQEYDEVFYIVSDLCILHRRSAYEDGVRLGFQLRNELT